MQLIPPAPSGVNTHEMLSTRGPHPRLSAHGFYWGLVTQASSAHHVAHLRTPREKAFVQFRHMSHSDQGVVGPSWNPRFRYLWGPTLQAGTSKKYSFSSAVPAFSI